MAETDDKYPGESGRRRFVKGVVGSAALTGVGTAAAADDGWLSASTEQGFVANPNKCTHFCCVPAFKAYVDSTKFGGPRGPNVTAEL